MRFEFCGKADCPDWILAQLFYASKLDLEKFQIICSSVRQTILADGNLDESKLFTELGINSGQGSGAFDIDDARACFAALHFIMANSCLYKISSTQLRNELEQLGLASGHCVVVCETLAQGDILQVREKLT